MDFLPILSVALGLLLIGLLIFVLVQVNRRFKNFEERQSTDASTLAETIRKDMDSKFSNERNEAVTREAGRAKVLTELQEKISALGKSTEHFEKTVDDLNVQVSGVKKIFDNPNRRGLFGESQLRDIVSDALPKELYELQYEVQVDEKKKVRFDCLVKLPDPPGPVGIDAKFPAEVYKQLVEAETDADKKEARKKFTTNVKEKMEDIASKYIIRGVTSEFALMFVPSEAIYLEIHESDDDIFETSRSVGVFVVSPSTLMAGLNTIRSMVHTMKVQEGAKEVLGALVDIGKQANNLKERAQKFEDGLRTTLGKSHAVVVTSGKIHTAVEKLQRGNTDLLESDDAPNEALDFGQEQKEQRN